MHKYVIKRLMALIPVLFIVSIVIFMLIHLIPGDPAAAMLGDKATAEQIAALRHTLGLDESLVLQYFHWIRDMLRGDFGTSLFMDGSMAEILRNHMAPTIQQTLVAIAFAALVGVVTVVGLAFISCLGGAAVTETIFNIPGIGKLTLNSVMRRDYEVVQAVVLVVSLLNVLCTLVLDLLYGLIDPRVRLS